MNRVLRSQQEVARLELMLAKRIEKVEDAKRKLAAARDRHAKTQAA